MALLRYLPAAARQWLALLAWAGTIAGCEFSATQPASTDWLQLATPVARPGKRVSPASQAVPEPVLSTPYARAPPRGTMKTGKLTTREVKLLNKLHSYNPDFVFNKQANRYYNVK